LENDSGQSEIPSNLSGLIISDNCDQVKNKWTVTDNWLGSKKITKPTTSPPFKFINWMKVLVETIILIGFGMTINVVRKGT
jgi:hypothetical protein